ncbi:hypothetical protein ILUMI_00067 [Ignelater luminosus]|uniref:Uncharacterized protein n=1 Tax=Ignelater luminosus TaxID=2038154 RepID=A0A8K0DKY8_IGNLU|nr:hypothetical protein ILUMI_00067 [Ignelater luminosus]
MNLSRANRILKMCEINNEEGVVTASRESCPAPTLGQEISEKKEDLIELFPSIDPNFHEFYRQLPSPDSEQSEDDDEEK